jgi:hypothetical protein
MPRDKARIQQINVKIIYFTITGLRKPHEIRLDNR